MPKEDWTNSIPKKYLSGPMSFFSLKLTMEMRSKVKNTIRIIASYENVINIDNKVDATSRWRMNEKH